ncbi:MAG TPA: tetratricopeptide repeat protein, partial [Thermodesulfovibrionales bacterium]|nr:tetratricopeptide repeat protein [Thermodesulfovibrionales bacterium]
VIWVSGPAGSGKTTLVASYLDSRRLPCLWYQLDEGDADIATFFYYMGLAAKKAAPRKRRSLPLFTPEYYMGIPTFTRRYFEELYSRSRPPSVIVFDNYQRVPVESPFHEAIVHGLTDLPEGINVIVISRAEPPQTFARIRASNKLKTIDWKDLQLTEEETTGFVSLYGKLSKETITHVHQQTQGWAAGMVLMIEKAKREDISPQLLSKYTQKEIFEYFAEEIFKKLDKETDDFLLRTAFLPSVITPSIADKLSGHDNADYILSRLSRSHFFTEMRSAGEDAYQYHPLFREFLLSKATEIFTPAAVTEIKRKAAELLEESDQIGDAAELYIEAGEWDRLVKLILNHAQDMVMHGRNKTLDNLLSHVPRETVFANPWLNYWLGVCRMPCSFQESRACFERAYEIFKEKKNAEGLFLSWFGVIDTYVHQMTDFSPLVYWISEIEKLLNECPEFPSPEAQARATAGIFYAMMYGQPHHPDFPLWEERLREGLLMMEDVYFRVVISNHLIIYYSWFNGEQAKAEILIKNLLTTFSRLSETQPFAYIEFRSKEAAHLMMTGRNDLALEALDKAFKAAETTGIHVWDFWLYTQGVNILLSDGDLKKAGEFLEKLGQIVNPERRAEAAYYYHQLSWELLCLGDLNAALEHARTALKMGIESGMHLAQGILMSGLAEALFDLGRYDEAIAYIEDARAMGRRFQGHMIEYHALLVLTRIFLRTGKTGAALESLRGHLRIGRECGMYNNLFWRSSAMAEICSKALEEGIETD